MMREEEGKIEPRPSNLRDRFDEILVDGDEIRAFLVVDDDISQADEQPLLFVDRI